MDACGERETRKLSTDAWLREGRFGVDSGMLVANGDRVSFVSRKGLVFEADRADIEVEWFRFKGFALHLTVGGEVYQLSFTCPSNGISFSETQRALSKTKRERRADMAHALPRALPLLLLGDTGAFYSDYRDSRRGKSSSKAWKAYFGTAAPKAPAASETAEARE